SVQNPSIHSSTGSTVACTALGMRNASACLVPGLPARLLVTLSLLSVVAAPGQHEHADPESHQWDLILTDTWDPRNIAKISFRLVGLVLLPSPATSRQCLSGRRPSTPCPGGEAALIGARARPGQRLFGGKASDGMRLR